MKRFLRCWKRLVLAFVLLVLFGAIAWLVLQIAADSSLRSALGEAREAGFAMRLCDLEPPALPEEQNGAPLYTAGAWFHPDPEGKDEVLQRAMTQGFLALDETGRVNLRAHWGRCDPWFKRIRLARARGDSRYDRAYVQGQFFPNDFIQMAHLLSLKVQSEREAGRLEEAMETARDIFAMADSHREEPYLRSIWARSRIIQVGLRAVAKCVTDETSETELLAWLDLLPPADALEGSFESSLRTHLAIACEWSRMTLREAFASLG